MYIVKAVRPWEVRYVNTVGMFSKKPKRAAQYSHASIDGVLAKMRIDYPAWDFYPILLIPISARVERLCTL